ncbi:MAG: hypothetical protein ACYS9X_28360 [Planctomycetota bacterium]|jgi:hypothetical protein
MPKPSKLFPYVFAGGMVLLVVSPLACIAGIKWLFGPPGIRLVRAANSRDIAALAVEGVDFPYAVNFERCTYVKVPGIDDPSWGVNTMRGGRLPAFRYAGATYVVLCYRRNWRRGMVTDGYDADDENLYGFFFEPAGNGLSMWTLDPQRVTPNSPDGPTAAGDPGGREE